MKSRFFALIALCVALLVVGGCNTENDNATANRNANVNANTTVATSTPVPTSTPNDNRRAPTREEYERNKERYQREAKESGRTVGTGLNDGWLWVKAKFDLAAADDLRDSTINVDVSNAIVTLTDSQGVARTTVTGKLGNFTFREVAAGETYVLTVSTKRYTFAPQIISPTENLAGITFLPQ